MFLPEKQQNKEPPVEIFNDQKSKQEDEIPSKKVKNKIQRQERAEKNISVRPKMSKKKFCGNSFAS